MEKKREIKRSSEKTFKGSAPQEFYSEGYFLKAEGSNYGRQDVITGEALFSPYTEEFYLARSRLVVGSLLKSIQGIKSAIVLGCARGYAVQAFHERNVEAVGVDISEWAIENGAELVKDYLYCGDVCDLSMWDDAKFDIVVALDVLEHIRVPDLYKALDETCRVGKVIVFDAPIDIDDTQPDKSDGADKSHVSIYSKEWWIAEFMKRGYEPIHVQEFTYPEEKFDVRWPDNHEHGVTIYFRRTRPPPTATTVSAVTVKPGGKDFRILWWSNSPWVGTGYGVGTKHVVYPLLEHYDIRCLSYYGQQWSALNYNGLICHGTLYDKYGIDAAQLLCNNRRWNPHIMITLFDIWIGDSPLIGERDWFTKINPYWVPYFPVDAKPIPPSTLNQARQAFQCVAMSQYGRRQLEMEGIDTRYIPHGVDTHVYKPTEDRGANYRNLLEISQPLVARNEHPWPEGCFVIGKVGANKDVPPRKGYDRDFKALEIFFDQNPDARKDTRMYIHSMANFPGGFPLAHLADINNVAPYIRVTEPFLVWCGLMPQDMNRMYGGFDVLLNASRSEGFGMPIIEAAACAVPTIATDFTCHDEITKALTEDGLKPYSELTVNDRVWTLGKNDKLELNKIKKTHIYDYDGEMIRFENKRIDLLVTPNHRVLYKKAHRKHEKNYEIKEAERFLKYGNESIVYLPTIGEWCGKEKPFLNMEAYNKDLNTSSKPLPVEVATNLLMKIAGWYISEGCLDRDKTKEKNKIRISNTKYQDEIFGLFKELGLNPLVINGTFTGVQVYSIALARFLKQFGLGVHKKTIPKWALSLSKTHLRCLFEALMKGDGSKCGQKDYIVYITVSEKLRDDIVQLFLKLGYSPKINIRSPSNSIIKGRVVKGSTDCYNIYIRRTAKGSIRGKQINKEQYKGKVWCLLTKNGNFFVERNGQVTCSGNSMTELVKDHGWLVNSLKNAGGFETFDTTILMSDWAIPDEFQIAEALEEAYNSPGKVRDFGEKSREFSLNYDWGDVITPLWVELIEELRERMRVKPREERRIL